MKRRHSFLFLGLLIVLLVDMFPFFQFVPNVLAASQGANYPTATTTSSENPYDDNDWANPTYVQADDAAYAAITAGTFDAPDYSRVLRTITFGFTVPAGTIDGIKVEVECYCDLDEEGGDVVLQLTKDNTTRVGTNKATLAWWATSPTIITYGGATDLWGTTWTVAEVNSANFGVHLAAQAGTLDSDIYVDFIRITIYYTVADAIKPTYSDVGTNTSIAGQLCLFYAKWTDETGLATTGGFIFGTNNTGSWTNETWAAFTANPDWSNVTKTLNTTGNIVIGYEWWANDTNNNWNDTGIQSMTLIGSDTLIAKLTDLVNRVTWTESIDTIYLGTMFGKTSMVDLQNAIAASTSWQDVLMWSAITIKFGIENETKIKWALNNATMVGGLPNVTKSDLGYDAFKTHHRGLLYGYYWANNYSYLQDKWNLTTAFNNFASAYNWTEHGFLWYSNATYTEGAGPRYFDECAETLACFLIFYEVCNVSEAITYAETEWQYINNHLWVVDPTYGGHYDYIEGAEDWECSGGAFLQIIGWLKHLSPSVGNISRLMADMSNRFIIDKWDSPQWTSESGTYWVFPAVVVHAKYTNAQRRLTSTVTAWSSLFSMYLLFNDTEIQNFQDELNGYANKWDSSPAWKCLYNITTSLYDSATGTFKDVSDGSASNYATALATCLQFVLGMTPVNASLAVPIESLEYEHLFNMFDSQIFNMSLATRKVTVGITKIGAINFTFNAVTTQMFNETGLFELTFDSVWNTITNCTRIGSLPERRYLELLTKLVVGWNTNTVFNADIGRTLEQICANIQFGGIDSTIVIKINGTEYRYDYGLEPNATVTILVTSDELQIYCTTSGNWYHDYSNFYYRKDSLSQSVSVSLSAPRQIEVLKSASQTIAVALGMGRLVEWLKSVSHTFLLTLNGQRLIEVSRAVSQAIATALQGIGAKITVYLVDALLTITTSFQAARLAEWFITVTQSISILFVGIRLAELAKTASLTLLLSLVGSRLIDVTRLGNQSIGVSIATSRLAEFSRSTSQALNVGFAMASAADFFRSVSQAVTATLNVQRLIEVTRLASQAITFGLQAIGEKFGNYVANVALTITATFQNSRLAEWTRQATQTLTLSLSTSRIAEFLAVAILTITATLNATYLMNFARQASQTLSFLFNGERLIEVSRATSQTITLALHGIGEQVGNYFRNALLTMNMIITSTIPPPTYSQAFVAAAFIMLIFIGLPLTLLMLSRRK